MSVLVVGGASGIGLEVSRDYASNSQEVIATGTEDPAEGGIEFRGFDVAGQVLFQKVTEFISKLPEISTLVYSEIFRKNGTIDELHPRDIEQIRRVNEGGLIYFTRALLLSQPALDQIVTLNQTIPEDQLSEPIYSTAIAGAREFTNQMSNDPRIGKCMVLEYQDQDPVIVAPEVARPKIFDYNYLRCRMSGELTRAVVVEKR